MLVLFDQGTPVPVRSYLEQHTVRTAAQQGWSALGNGELLTAAELAGFDVFVTTDKNLRYQQNLSGRRIAIVVIGYPQWPGLEPHIGRIVAAVNEAIPASYVEIEIPSS
jgi:hypothetical protein